MTKEFNERRLKKAHRMVPLADYGLGVYYEKTADARIAMSYQSYYIAKVLFLQNFRGIWTNLNSTVIEHKLI